MAEIEFIWDEAKDRSNRRKHGVSFSEACHVFADPLHQSWQDRIEGGEQRWQTLGFVGGVIVLLVAHTFVEDGSEHEPIELIRIISARRATPRERSRYENG